MFQYFGLLLQLSQTLHSLDRTLKYENPILHPLSYQQFVLSRHGKLIIAQPIVDIDAADNYRLYVT